ncbi:MAG: flippase [Candidatus Doudnabacteria bacterium]
MSKVTRNILSLVFSRVLAAALVFVGYASMFRYLGTYSSGQYQFVLSYVLLFSVVVDFGIQQLVIKKVSENREEGKKYLGHFFAVEFVLALGIWIVLSGIAIFAGYDQLVRNGIFVAGFGMFLNALTIPHKSILSAHEDMHHIAIINFFDSVINVAVIFSAIFLGKSVVFLSLVQVFNGLMHVLAYKYLIRRYVPKPELFNFLKSLDFSLIKKMMTAALPFGMLVGFSVVYNKIDIIILTHFRGYAETGLYTAAYKFVDLLAFIPAVVSSSLYPFISARLASEDKETISSSLQKYTRMMLALAIPLMVGGVILAKKLIVVVGGSDFFGGYVALQILVLASGILFIYAAVNSVMVNQLTKIAVKVTFINIFLNVLGNIIFIPIYGLKAAAVMTVVSELTQASLYFYFVRKKIVSFKFFRYIWQPLFSALLMGMVLWPLRYMSLGITLPVGLIVYFVVLSASGFVKKEDFLFISNLRSVR